MEIPLLPITGTGANKAGSIDAYASDRAYFFSGDRALTGSVSSSLGNFEALDHAWLANNTRWVISPLTRSLLIAFIHPSTGQPTVNSYVETPPWRRPKLP